MKKKFRIYDRANKQMVYSSASKREGKREYYPIEFGIGFQFDVSDLSEPMMDTGLTDKNGKTIWEDDYTVTEHGIMKVFFIDGRFILMWADNGTHYEELYKMNKRIEISGNAHEHSISTTQEIKKNKK